MELTKRDTKMLQGLSVLAMLCLHLFDRNYQNLFQPLIFVGGIPFSFYVAQLSDFCVFGFAFCSGYAYMTMYGKTGYFRSRIKSVFMLLCKYWTVIFLFSFISTIAGHGNQIPGDFRTLINNIFLINVTYNGAWWYMWAYIILVLFSPLILKIVNKFDSVVILSVGFFVYCVAYYYRFHVNTANYFLQKFGPFGMTLFEYLIGCVWRKRKVLSWMHIYWKRLQTKVQAGISLIIILGLLIGHTKIIPSLFVAPFTGLILITLFHFWKKPKVINNIFFRIGKHSTYIWLTHMFFIYKPFENLVYIAKYPILIYILIILITVAVSYVLQFVEKPLIKRLA